MTYTWARYHRHGYEVSSAGDRRFSAFVARLPSGLTIEQAWQQAKGSSKGKPAIHKDFDYWATYLSLWQEWAQHNPTLLTELARLANQRVITDRFASTNNNQARALAHILNTER